MPSDRSLCLIPPAVSNFTVELAFPVAPRIACRGMPCCCNDCDDAMLRPAPESLMYSSQ